MLNRQRRRDSRTAAVSRRKCQMTNAECRRVAAFGICHSSFDIAFLPLLALVSPLLGNPLSRACAGFPVLCALRGVGEGGDVRRPPSPRLRCPGPTTPGGAPAPAPVEPRRGAGGRGGCADHRPGPRPGRAAADPPVGGRTVRPGPRPRPVVRRAARVRARHALPHPPLPPHRRTPGRRVRRHPAMPAGRGFTAVTTGGRDGRISIRRRRRWCRARGLASSA